MGIGDGSNSGTTGSKRRSTSPLNNNQAPAVLNRGSSGDLEEILGQVSSEIWVIEGYGCYSILLVCYFMWSSALGSSCPFIKLYTGGVLYPVG